MENNYQKYSKKRIFTLWTLNFLFTWQLTELGRVGYVNLHSGFNFLGFTFSTSRRITFLTLGQLTVTVFFAIVRKISSIFPMTNVWLKITLLLVLVCSSGINILIHHRLTGRNESVPVMRGSSSERVKCCGSSKFRNVWSHMKKKI